MYVHIFILRICTRRRRCLRGFRWYPYFCSSGAVSGIRGKQMTPAVASERSIFSKNHDYIKYLYIKRVFRVAVNTYVPIFLDIDARGGRKLRTDTHTHTRRTATVTIIIKIIRSDEAQYR